MGNAIVKILIGIGIFAAMMLELALARAEANDIASRQPGYNPKDAADIKRRVDEILEHWRM